MNPCAPTAGGSTYGGRLVGRQHRPRPPLPEHPPVLEGLTVNVMPAGRRGIAERVTRSAMEQAGKQIAGKAKADLSKPHPPISRRGVPSHSRIGVLAAAG